jgi:hypothetical protein
VILVNKFDIPPEDVDRFLACGTEDASYSKKAVRVHLRPSGIAVSVFLNLAV